MKKVTYTNKGKTFVHIGGKVIAPGDTREVDPSLIPNYQDPAPAAPKTNKDEVLALLDLKVPEVVEALPGLSAEDFDRIKLAEENGKTRKSLLKAFAEEDLRRANAKVGGSADDQNPPAPESDGGNESDQSDDENSEDDNTGSEGSGDADSNSNE